MLAHRQRKLLLAHPTLTDNPIKRILLLEWRTVAIAIVLSRVVVVAVVAAVDDAIGHSRGRSGSRVVRVRMLGDALGTLDGD